ncbi:uncharacterized protein IL334_000391 [Kwoniella shivajii]|uniref:Uncharacterized protein n=1 Tax=Kwoniella shivajii TaxID=564305 RepID=A0ABZ1CS30_9TREE|nr:hypothetical protein IL334_000391 [Kwoniella shivajii]
MSSSTATRITSSSLIPLIRSLPASPLSAEAVQLSDALGAIAEKALSSAPTASANGSSMEALKVAGHQRRLTQMRDSISRIRSGQALSNYPLTGPIVSPPNDPHYYTRVRNGVRNAEQGIQRPWWKVFFNVKGEE